MATNSSTDELPYPYVPNIVFAISNVICVLAVILNLLHGTFLVLKTSARFGKSRNFEIFLLFLAVCDVLMMAGRFALDHRVVQEIVYKNHWLCVLNTTIIHSLYIFETTVMALLSIERLMAVSYPHYYDRSVSKKNVIVMLLSAYGSIQLLYCLLAAAYHNRGYSVKGSGSCTMSSDEMPKLINVTMGLAISNLLLITITSVLLITKTHQLATRYHPTFVYASTQRTMRQNKVKAITLAALVITKVICWLPLIIASGLRTTKYGSLTADFIGRVMMYVFSLVSPLIYGATNREYLRFIKNKISCANFNRVDSISSNDDKRIQTIPVRMGHHAMRDRSMTSSMVPRDP